MAILGKGSHTVLVPLSEHTRNNIRTYLTEQLVRYIEDQKSKGSAWDIQPFHARLLPDLFKIPLSERSFSTRSGGWFQQMAKMVALQFHAHVEQPHVLEGHIQPAASSHIETMLSKMDKGKPKRRPNREQDIKEVLTVQSTGGANFSVIVDLFIKTHSGEEWYFEMKTAQPNKGQCKEMKRFILQVAAARHEHKAAAYASTAYNPFGDGKPITDGKIRQFLEPGKDILMGREFWHKIGDESTYDELLAIAEVVGKSLVIQTQS